MTQEAMPPRDAVGEWFEIYAQDEAEVERIKQKLRLYSVLKQMNASDWPNPWANGDYAFLGIVCGLLFMLIVSVGVSI